MILRSLTEDNARKVCKWKYSKPYDIYNYDDWESEVREQTSLTIDHIREEEYVAFLVDEIFVGFARIKVENEIVLGIGLDPAYCSKGYGYQAMTLLVEESINRYPLKDVTLEVRTFNERAINLYKKCNFEVIKEYVRRTPTGEGTFYKMKLKK